MNSTYHAPVFATRKIFYLKGKEFGTMREACKQFLRPRQPNRSQSANTFGFAFKGNSRS
jgi:hypothetical protein